jgi:hypothetical protein
MWRRIYSKSMLGVEDYKSEELESQDEELRKAITV